MYGECHAHVFMDGISYSDAVKRHCKKPQEKWIRQTLELYRKEDIHFIRDGGDAYGVSRLTKDLAPEYDIDYRTPIFAIHKEGHYGKIVGKSFTTMKEYHQRVLEAREQGADFIKIMTTGILNFDKGGEITGSPLPASEVREMVHIAHEEGMAVMSHTNGAGSVADAIEAGVDSVEHGFYMDEETIWFLSESSTIWVPTTEAVEALLASDRYPHDTIVAIARKQREALKTAYSLKAKVALGSDAGAFLVFHASGVKQECQTFLKVLGDTEEVRAWMQQGEDLIKDRFRRK